MGLMLIRPNEDTAPCDNYKYAHSYSGNFVQQQFLPDEIKDQTIWTPQQNADEQKHVERMQQLWGDKYKNNDKKD